MSEMTIGRTRWGRFSVVTVFAAVAIVALGLAIAKGLLAASFNVNNKPFQIQSAGLDGKGFGAIMDDVTKDNADGSISGQAVARAGFEAASLDGLCAAVHQQVLGLPFTLKISAGTAGDGIKEISAGNLVLDGESVNADATLTGTALGKSADDIVLDDPSNPAAPAVNPLEGTAGNFGMQASTANLSKLNAKAYGTTIAGSIKLDGLALGIETGTNNCTIVQ